MEWKPVKGYEGLYEVSDEGQVRSLDRKRRANIRNVTTTWIKGKVLKPNLKHNGYYTVDLCRDGKITTTTVHRIVADAFIPNPEGKHFVNHIDSDRTNNTVSNLEWVTSSENRIHGIKSGNVTFSQTRSVTCVETAMTFEKAADAARWVAQNYPERVNGKISIAANNIRGACRGRTPRAYGFTWKRP